MAGRVQWRWLAVGVVVCAIAKDACSQTYIKQRIEAEDDVAVPLPDHVADDDGVVIDNSDVAYDTSVPQPFTPEYTGRDHHECKQTKGLSQKDALALAPVLVDGKCSTYDAKDTAAALSLGICTDDNCDGDVHFARRVNRRMSCSDVENIDDGQCQFASSDAALEADGYEAPDVRNPSCTKSNDLHCIPSPCSVLTMSYFRDPKAESKPIPTSFNHTCCIGAKKSTDPACTDAQCDSRVFVGTEYEQHRSIRANADGTTTIIGHSTCDAQFGTDLFKYMGNTDRFRIINRTTREALTEMQRTSRDKCGTDTCFENWPNKLVIPTVLQHQLAEHELPANPSYMYQSSTPEEKEQFDKFFAGETELPPDPDTYQCHEKKPPPTIWVLPCCPQEGFEPYTMNEAFNSNYDNGLNYCNAGEQKLLYENHGILVANHLCADPDNEKMFELVYLNEPRIDRNFEKWSLAMIKERLIAAAHWRSYQIHQWLRDNQDFYPPDDLYDPTDADQKTLMRNRVEKLATDMNFKMGYTFERISAHHGREPHPLRVSCMSSSTINRYDSTKQTGVDADGVVYLGNCEHDDRDNARVGFGTISATYQSDSAAITTIPQMADIFVDGVRRPQRSMDFYFNAEKGRLTEQEQKSVRHSMPGAFARHGQLLGIVPTPQLLTYKIRREDSTSNCAGNHSVFDPECAADDGKVPCDQPTSDHVHHSFCVTAKLFKLFNDHYFKKNNIHVYAPFKRVAEIARAMQTLEHNFQKLIDTNPTFIYSTRMREDSNNVAVKVALTIQEHPGYTKETCHIFSSYALNGAGCNWLPVHELPGVCMDQRAKRQKDIVVPAHQTFTSETGHNFGFLNFDEYKCSNFRMTPHYAHFEDSQVDERHFPTLQHAGPLNCLKARSNAILDNVKYHPDVTFADWSGRQVATNEIGKALEECLDGRTGDDALLECSTTENTWAGGFSRMHAETQGYKKVETGQNNLGSHIFRFSQPYASCLNTDVKNVPILAPEAYKRKNVCLYDPLRFMQMNFDNNVAVPLSLNTAFKEKDLEKHNSLDGTVFFKTDHVSRKVIVPRGYTDATFSKNTLGQCTHSHTYGNDGSHKCFPPALDDYKTGFCTIPEQNLGGKEYCALKQFIAIYNVYTATQVIGSIINFRNKRFRRSNLEDDIALLPKDLDKDIGFGQMCPNYEDGDCMNVFMKHNIFGQWAAWIAHDIGDVRFNLANPDNSVDKDPIEGSIQHCFHHANIKSEANKPMNDYMDDCSGYACRSHFYFAPDRTQAFSYAASGEREFSWSLSQKESVRLALLGQSVSEMTLLTEMEEIRGLAAFQNFKSEGLEEGTKFAQWHQCDRLITTACAAADAKNVNEFQAKAALDPPDVPVDFTKHRDYKVLKDACKRYEHWKPHLYDGDGEFLQGRGDPITYQHISVGNIPRTPANPKVTGAQTLAVLSHEEKKCNLEVSIPSLFKMTERSQFCDHSGLLDVKFDSRIGQPLASIPMAERKPAHVNFLKGFSSAKWLFTEHAVADRGTPNGFLLQTPMTAFGRDGLSALGVKRHAPFMFCPKSACKNSSYAPRSLQHIDPRLQASGNAKLLAYLAYPWGNINVSDFPAEKSMLASACNCCGRGDEYMYFNSDGKDYRCYRGASLFENAQGFAEPGGPLVDRCFCQTNVNVLHTKTPQSNDDLTEAANYYRTTLDGTGRIVESSSMLFQRGIADATIAKAKKEVGPLSFLVDTAAKIDKDISDRDVRDLQNGTAVNKLQLKKSALMKAVTSGEGYLALADAKPGHLFTDVYYDDAGDGAADATLRNSGKGFLFNSDYALAIKTGGVYFHHNYSILSIHQQNPLSAQTKLQQCRALADLKDTESPSIDCTRFYGISENYANSQPTSDFLPEFVRCEDNDRSASMCFALGNPDTYDIETGKNGNPLPAAFFFGGKATASFRFNPRQFWFEAESRCVDDGKIARGYKCVYDELETNIDRSADLHSWETCDSMVVGDVAACKSNYAFEGTKDNEWSISLSKLDPDFVSTTAIRDAHITNKFQLVVPFNGNAFARNQPYTSSMTPGAACDCHRRRPLLSCRASTVEQTRNANNELVDNLFKAYSPECADSENPDCKAEEPSLDVIECGYAWDEGTIESFGLRMGGMAEPFYVTHRHLFKSDNAPQVFLDKMFDKKHDSKKEIPSGDFWESLRFKGRHNSRFNSGFPWKFKSSCLKWPYGQAHYESFPDADKEMLLSKGSVERDSDGNNVRSFDEAVQIGYCERVVSSSAGNNRGATSKLTYCVNDAMSAQDRSDWCKKHPLSNAVFSSLYISNVQPSHMCNDKYCLFVPGHRSAPTLKSFLNARGLDFTGKTVFVAPFTTKSLGFGFYSGIYSGSGMVDPTTINKMGIYHAKMFQIATHVRQSDDDKTITNACTEFYNMLCKNGDTCLRISQPDFFDAKAEKRRESNSAQQPREEVIKPMHDIEIVLSARGLRVEGAVRDVPMLFDNANDNQNPSRTRFVVEAPEVSVGALEANQAGCSNGMKCAAVVIKGPNASYTNIAATPGSLGVKVTNAAVPVMALGRTGHDLGVVDLHNSVIRVNNDDAMDHVVGISAAKGTVFVSCTTETAHSCSALAQYEPPPTELNIAMMHGSLPIYNISESIGLFGLPAIKELTTRPIDHGAVSMVGFYILIIIAITLILFHAALFAKATPIAVWIVQKRATIHVCDGDQWSCVYSVPKGGHIIKFADKSRETATVLVIARIICGVDGGCDQYADYPDLIDYAWSCFKR